VIIAYGLAGLATCWGYAAILKLAPTAAADALFIITAAAWLVLIAGYLSQAPRRPGGWRTELADPVMGPFVSLIPIVGMLLAIGLMPHSLAAGRWLFGIFAATTLLAGWMTGQWIVEDLDLDKLHSGYVLPAVAGGFIASIGAAHAGWTGLAHAFMGLGVVSWLLIGSVILARLLVRPPLPRPLTPTLPYAAAATFALHWLNYGKPFGYKTWAWIILLAITVFIAALTAQTTAALRRRRFLPQLQQPLTRANPGSSAWP
jgi:tellurite resistance protein